MWKKVLEKEEKNSKLKVGINVAMVKWDESIVDVCVTTQGQRENMPIKVLPKRDVSPTKGQ